MSIPVIRQALETPLNTWATANSIPVAWQGQGFTKPSNGFFCEAILIPNNTLNREVSMQRTTLIGLFQVNVWMQKGKGTGALEAKAESVKALYPTLPKGVVSIEQTPDIGRIILDDSGWLILPITVKWRYEET